MTVATNLHGLAGLPSPDGPIEVQPFVRAAGGLLARVRACRRALSCDYVVVNCSPADLFDVCLVKLLLPFTRARIVSLDTVLPVPHADRLPAKLKLGVKRLLFRKVHLFIEYFRDTAGYEHHYGIPRDRFRYVPFKINRYDRIAHTATRDDGYVFCGGNTRRDFKTLIEAVRGLAVAVKIVTMDDRVIAGHGSVLDEQDLPANIEVIRHDGSDSFLDYIAGARLVALPIRRENISASGIGVYLAAMALGKCVVISDGPAVNGTVPTGAAIIVPPEDAKALRAAIERAAADADYRNRIAASGQAYALSLGGEEQLCTSVAQVIARDRQGAK